jgi:hypothetical protein
MLRSKTSAGVFILALILVAHSSNPDRARSAQHFVFNPPLHQLVQYSEAALLINWCYIIVLLCLSAMHAQEAAAQLEV